MRPTSCFSSRPRPALLGRALAALPASLLLLTLGACVPVAPAPVAPSFGPADPAEYTAYLTPGDATLSGQAFLTTRGGDVKKAAGREVTLDPATRYARQWYYGPGQQYSQWAFVPSDTLFRKARRTTQADADGRFTFTNVPPGDYIVRSTVTWEVVMSAYSSSRQGGVVGQLVTVGPKESKQVILNEVVGR